MRGREPHLGRRRRASSGRPSICSIVQAVASALARLRPSVDLSLRRDRARRRVLVETRPRAERQRARHASRARSGARRRARLSRPRHRIGARLSAVDRAFCAKTIRSARRIRTASASWRRRCSPPRRRTRRCFIVRPFNHAGPRQSPTLRDVELRAADRRDRGRHARAGAARRQPRLAPRHHRRPRHRARLSARRASTDSPDARTTSAPAGLPHSGSARHRSSRMSRPAIRVEIDPDAPAAERQSGHRRRSIAHRRRDAAGSRQIPIEQHARRICSTTGAADRSPTHDAAADRGSPKTAGRSSTWRWARWRSLLRYLTLVAGGDPRRRSRRVQPVRAASARAARCIVRGESPAALPLRHRALSARRPAADPRVSRSARHRRRGVGRPRVRRRHGDAGRTTHLQPADSVEP